MDKQPETVTEQDKNAEEYISCGSVSQGSIEIHITPGPITFTFNHNFAARV